MPDPREWMAPITRVEPPDLWAEAEARARSGSVGSGGEGRSGDQRPRGTPRLAALITGITTGVLAVTVVFIALRA